MESEISIRPVILILGGKPRAPVKCLLTFQQKQAIEDLLLLCLRQHCLHCDA